MFIAPAATAYLLTRRLAPMVALAVVMGCLSAWMGYLGALRFNTSVAGMMSVSAGGLFAVALFLAPQQGLLASLLRRGALRYQITLDDIRGILYRWHEVVGDAQQEPLRSQDIFAALGSTLTVWIALRSLILRGEVCRVSDASLRLTERGKVEAATLVRSHRLWESYLAKHLGLPLDHLHAPSERTEHYIGRALARDIERDVARITDPHGKEIP